MSRIDSFDPPEANPDVRRARPPGPPGPLGFIAGSLLMGWRWLRRMRTALYLLGVLGLLTLLATAVPQEPNVAATVREWRAGTAGPGRLVSGLIDLVGGYDVFGSPLFLATLLLLFTSLTACLLPRYRAWWRILRRTVPPRTRHLGDQEHVEIIETDLTRDAALAEARALLRRRRWRLRPPEFDAGEPAQVAGEKGHALREGGSLMFHTSFYVLLVAVVLGQLLGFSGQVGIVEGQAWADTEIGYWTYAPGRWWSPDDHTGFQLTLDRFDVDWYRDPRLGGQPKLFQSAVTITRPDGGSYQDTVGGNDPLLVDGMKIHQLDWGYAPRIVVEVDGEVVHDGFLTFTATEQGVYRGAVKAPRPDPDVGLEVFLVPYAPQDETTGQPNITGAPWADAPLLLFTEWRGDLQLDRVQNVNRLETVGLEETGAGVLRPGGEFSLPDGVTVRFPELRRWVGFQVSRRPTAPWLLVGGGLVLLGLVPALYAYRRRLWVAADADPTSGRTVVTVAGRTFQRPQAFEKEHADLVAALQERITKRADDPATRGGDTEPLDETTEAVHP